MKEVGELRRRLSGEEAAPYLGYARKLLGELKTQMAFAELPQLSRTKDLPDGVRVTVASRFGQDEIQISVPVAPAPSAPPEMIVETASFVPYLWVGVRCDGDLPAGVGLYLYVWDDNGEQLYLSDSIVSFRGWSSRESTAEWPLGDNDSAFVADTMVCFNTNQVICYRDYMDDEGVIWDTVVIASDDAEDPDMKGFVTKQVAGTYHAAVCAYGPDCEETAAIDVIMKIVVGRKDAKKGAEAAVVKTQTKIQSISQFTYYYRATRPYGRFRSPQELGPCDAVADSGPNPHWDNWCPETAHIHVPPKQIHVPKEQLGLPSIVFDETPPDGFAPGEFPSRDDRCPKCSFKLTWVLAIHTWWYWDREGPTEYVCHSHSIIDCDPGAAAFVSQVRGIWSVDDPDTINFPTHLLDALPESAPFYEYSYGSPAEITGGPVNVPLKANPRYNRIVDTTPWIPYVTGGRCFYGDYFMMLTVPDGISEFCGWESIALEAWGRLNDYDWWQSMSSHNLRPTGDVLYAYFKVVEITTSDGDGSVCANQITRAEFDAFRAAYPSGIEERIRE